MANKPAEAAKNPLVISISRMTIHNGPGIRTLILLKGCPLRCAWCSTPESQAESAEIAFSPDRCILCGDCMPVCPSGAISAGDKAVILNRKLCDICGRCVSVCHAQALRLIGTEYTVGELVGEVMKDEIVFRHSGGGVTVSGGEPLLKPEFILELLKELKKNGISIGVDTCGCIPRRHIEQVLPYVDFFLWDIKHMDDKKHREYTGASGQLILDNLCFVSENGTPVYLRVPVIPGYNDSGDNLRAVCEFAGSLPSLVEIHLLPLHHLGRARYAALGREYTIEGIPLIPEDVLIKLKSRVESYGLKCEIIG